MLTVRNGSEVGVLGKYNALTKDCLTRALATYPNNTLALIV